MRSVEDARSRWKSTLKDTSSLTAFKRRIRSTSNDNSCHRGLRSVCWKAFLLFQNLEKSSWVKTIADSRAAYSSLREHFLGYLEHSDELGSAADPLNDDKSSPWNTLRQDEETRAEIFQDVERCMPEEPYFRQPETQRLLLDILFIWCKLNQDVGYRQGMHELLAPILWVIETDAIEARLVEEPAHDEQLMANILDSRYIEHDSFTLFSLLMQHAKSFYDLGEPERKSSTPTMNSSIVPPKPSPIVERSSDIHQVYLAKVDPELSAHLKDIEILPQIFLIRWIRLLFGREFPFEELLDLWDVLFAEDPALDLVDMICVAMLLRIRWQLIEADYSTALTLLLKYPPPLPPYGPKGFVEDATFLRDHFTISGGSEIVEKYSGKSLVSPPSSRFGSPRASPLQSYSLRGTGTKPRAHLPSPARFLQQQGGVEALLQVAAKGVFERGEKLGINQRVRDAVVEVRKNVQGLQTPRPPGYHRSASSRWSLDEGRAIPSPQKSAQVMEHRNKVLGRMLDVATEDLRSIASAPEDLEAKQYLEAIDVALAKIQFIQVYLEDSSMPLPDEHDPEASTSSRPGSSSAHSSTQVKTGLEEPADISGTRDLGSRAQTPRPVPDTKPDSPAPVPATPERKDTKPAPSVQPPESAPLGADLVVKDLLVVERPKAPVPTRSSLAQSSFAFMLEPGETPSSPPKPTLDLPKSSKKINAPSREKAAFLFGDASDDESLMGKRKSPQVDEEDGTCVNLGTIKGKRPEGL